VILITVHKSQIKESWKVNPAEAKPVGGGKATRAKASSVFRTRRLTGTGWCGQA